MVLFLVFVFVFFFGNTKEVSLLVFLTETLQTIFHVAAPIYNPKSAWGFPFLHIQILVFVVFLMIAILTNVRWYLIVVLICISMLIINVEHFSCVCCTSVCLFFNNVYPVSLFFTSFFLCWVVWILCILWILSLNQICLFQTSSPIK